MVDASSLGTACVTAYRTQDIEFILDAVAGEEDLSLTRDLILRETILDEGRSLALVGEQVVKSVAEVRAELKRSHTWDDAGKYTPPVVLAFVQMSAMRTLCADLGAKMKDDDKIAREQEQAKLEAAEYAELRLDEVRYSMKSKEWIVPETVGEDTRQGDERIVAGGAPRQLEADAKTVIRQRRPPQKITAFSTAEKNDKGIVKVYIEDQGVANADEARISVTFMADAYSVRVEPPEGDANAAALTLGPVTCGALEVEQSSWRLSKGKRLTISLAMQRQSRADPKVMMELSKARANAGMPWKLVVGGVVLLLSLLALPFLAAK
mmetsp:Transcript_90168/g.254309  ORF Transcript_90168/g.254309 Transcript_90168/m.254309 type:complete len:322 (+) Transcript_90168:86-1051(+)|eukprot:CAMPEP_0117509572 /NCGR_PEP_ID=MMETSP0784-20121206/27544_1 /TAXON_ID=39447 /ORGANISM="" /LENGTH=321 /DNA_ID=CAMNT_0005305183 /DNA_START=17 /DNA_END=982 /DNA_ORIENTATION=-